MFFSVIERFQSFRAEYNTYTYPSIIYLTYICSNFRTQHLIAIKIDSSVKKIIAVLYKKIAATLKCLEHFHFTLHIHLELFTIILANDIFFDLLLF